jgi:hypothetical protein
MRNMKDSRRTRRFVAAPCRFHGAAATKSGAARTMIEVAKRIVLIEEIIVKRLCCCGLFFQTRGRPAVEECRGRELG